MTNAYTSMHGLEATPIAAQCQEIDDVAWLRLTIGDLELTVFMPAARAKRLAAAINGAEEITKAEAADPADPIAEGEAVF